MGKRGLNNSNCRDILADATAAVYISDQIVGTAWLCSNRYLITAGHFCSNTSHVYVSFNENLKSGKKSKKYTAEVIYSKEIEISGVDFAILKLECDTDKNFLPIEKDKVKYNGQTIISYGYGSDCSGAAEGRVLGSHNCCQNKMQELIKIESNQLISIGYSGAAIFDISLGKVIGIQIESVSSNGREKNTALAFPMYRLYQECKNITEFTTALNWNVDTLTINELDIENTVVKNIGVWSKEFIENHLLPLLAISILNLQRQDNLDAYVRCIIVKYEKKKRYTVYEAKSNDRALYNLTEDIRKKNNKSRGRSRDYGVVGVMNQQNVTVLCDFKNKKFYKISLSGGAELVNMDFDENAGEREGRIALLVSPIRDSSKKIIGLLSFDFFAQNDANKDIVEIIQKNSLELDRLIFHSTYYAEVISKALNDGLFKL